MVEHADELTFEDRDGCLVAASEVLVVAEDPPVFIEVFLAPSVTPVVSE